MYMQYMRLHIYQLYIACTHVAAIHSMYKQLCNTPCYMCVVYILVHAIAVQYTRMSLLSMSLLCYI